MESEGPSGDVGDGVYLDVDDVIALCAQALGCSDSDAANQLRDRGALEGALARPLWYANLEGADLAKQASVLAHGVAESQPFVDGNKRAALVAMLTFLEANGFAVRTSQSERADWMLGFAHGVTVDDLSRLAFARCWSRSTASQPSPEETRGYRRPCLASPTLCGPPLVGISPPLECSRGIA